MRSKKKANSSAVDAAQDPLAENTLAHLGWPQKMERFGVRRTLTRISVER